jgi:hypothetical protein
MTTDQPVQSDLIRVAGRAMPREQAVTQAKNAANWFWWISGLSLVNSIAVILELDYAMLLGLGVTQIADAILTGALKELTGSAAVVAKMIHAAIVLGAAGFFYLLGVKARAFRLWAYPLGMALYACDALIFLLAQDWVGVGFHAFVLFMLWGGYGIARAVVAAGAVPPPQQVAA